MEVESSTYTDFISCDRAGRRNAVHDIQQDATTISMRKLTEDLGDLAVKGAESQRDATSSENDPGARPKGQEDSPSP
ncbi:cAMP-dependent protein kinase inhibitor gamma isoform X2 [Nyctibius grandis]